MPLKLHHGRSRGEDITMFPVERLIEIIEEIARGNYSNNIMPLTTEENPEPVRIITEAMARD
jgi:hypothetical protein